MHILIIDDEATLRRMLRLLLTGQGHTVVEASTASDGLARAAEGVDVVLLDVQLPDRSGLEILGDFQQVAPAARILMMTAYGTIDRAVQAMRDGAWDFLTKPFDNDELLARLARLEEVQRLEGEVRSLRSELESRYGLDELVGSSPAMAPLFAAVHKVAPTEATVLIQGESGTGKELVARAIHRISRRHDGPFVPVNCGAIPETLVEATFFGHERGAFTDAHTARTGVLEQASGGTLFLDEVAELPLESQAALLRVLQEHRFSPIGGQRSHETDLRLIAASNVDLDLAVRDGRFREDLYWRLEVITVQVPPLRQRSGDIPALADHLLEKRAHELGVPLKPLTPHAVEILCRYSWPGNVRELENTLYRALVLAEGEQITPADLPPRLRGAEVSTDAASPASDEGPLEELTSAVIERFEAAVIRRRLRRFAGSRTRTAESLGVARKTLFNKMQRYGITLDDQES